MSYRPGPGLLVTAAFIGPGTVTTCILAGVESGYQLLWVLVFAVFTAIVLQEMAARLGWVSGEGLGEAMRRHLPAGITRGGLMVLVVMAILIGNAAYEAGNIAGAMLGGELLLTLPREAICIFMVLFAAVTLWRGSYQRIQAVLLFLVMLLSLCFVAAAILILTRQGMQPREWASTPLTRIMALIGTTVVPYNLFLHASAVTQVRRTRSLHDVRLDTVVAIALGGLVSAAIIVTAAAVGESHEIRNAADLAVALQDNFGSLGRWLVGLGLLLAGLSSAITAPLAAAFAARGIFGWEGGLDNAKTRAVWIAILCTGLIFALTGTRPVHLIQLAQATNALLLPAVAVTLWVLCNRVELMQSNKNGVLHNLMAALVLMVILVLSARALAGVWGSFSP